ncbi:MAG: hypothetical protein ACKOWL_03500 [Sphingobacteriaceae bacterium]
MKKTVLVVALFLGFSTRLGAQSLAPIDYPVLRKALVKAVDSEALTDSLLLKITPFPNKTPFLVACMATLQGLKAKHHWNPYSKLHYLQLANKNMNKAVEADLMNLEIRFMRFSMQHFTPSFLGYSKQLAEDKRMIVKLYETQHFEFADTIMIKSIARFMLESRRCNDAEKQLFKKFA